MNTQRPRLRDLAALVVIAWTVCNAACFAGLVRKCECQDDEYIEINIPQQLEFQIFIFLSCISLASGNDTHD